MFDYSAKPNFSKWMYYMKDVFSPTSWVMGGWVYVVTSALQRRVWYGNIEDKPLFPNLYMVFIGPPACGKGLVIEPVNKLITYWPKKETDLDREPAPGEEIPKLITTGPDKITPESLYQEMSKSIRRFDYTADGKQKIYCHSSMAFVLEEMNALFRRNMDEVPKFMLKAFDCGDYSYKTKHQGNDMIRKMCMNFLAAGTPAILKEAADYHIFDDGFTSRTIFIFEREPRYYSYELPERSDDQVKAFRELLPWIKSLAGLFGRINYSDEAKQFLIDTCDRDHKALVAKAGPKMQSYLGRRGVMIKKIAAALHFSESLSLDIPVERFAEAIEFLKPLEANMQGGFSVVGRNELHPYSNMIRNHLKFASGASTAELLSIFASDLSAEELNEVLTGLVMAEQVDIRGSKYYAK